ncbi:Serine/threonine-protein phosphatase 6 regulatory ankyrin repeat subunit A-like 2, partial [Homarus americanus]
MGCTRLTRRILQKHPRQDLVNILQELSENSRPVEERLSEIKELLQQHPDIVKYCGSQKYPAMHTAAINDESQVMELLIQHDADIEAKDATDHRTPLFFTITKQSIRCFQLLLEKGANVNAVGRDGKSVLHVAVEHNVKHGKMVRELIRRGASLKYTIVKSGYTPIHTAACIGDYELLKMFLKHDRNAANFCDRKGNVPLHLSAEKGHKYSCNILLQYGANIDVNNKMKETPLHLAVKGSFISTCEELLISHCNINSEDKDGNTALLSSTASNKRCSKDILELLLQHKADIYVKRPNGDSALHLAAKAGYPDKCLLLVQAGADCNLQNVNGMTPLHYATKKGFTECSAVILNLPLNGDSNQYFIPVNVLCEEEEEEEEEDEGKEKDVVCGGRAQCTVFHSSVDVNVKDNDGKMPIHYAVEKGSKECVMQLLKRKANIVIATPDGDTPLHLAARA